MTNRNHPTRTGQRDRKSFHTTRSRQSAEERQANRVAFEAQQAAAIKRLEEQMRKSYAR